MANSSNTDGPIGSYTGILHIFSVHTHMMASFARWWRPTRFRLDLYEEPDGSFVRDMSRLAHLCERPRYGVGEGYVRGKLKLPDPKRRKGVFALTVSTDDTGLVTGFVRGSLHLWRPGIQPTRIMWIDLVCSDPAHKGMGSIMMKEVEEYARNLGATIIILQSVLDPDTIAFYRRKGFRRGIGPRDKLSVARARELFKILRNPKRDMRHVVQELRAHHPPRTEEYILQLRDHVKQAQRTRKTGPKMVKDFIDALEEEFYPLYNDLTSSGSTVAMYKLLPREPGTPAPTLARAVAWDRAKGGAKYVRPVPHRVLATYQLRNRWLERVG
jgi:GNAT superfamily N-acetyltransferase